MTFVSKKQDTKEWNHSVTEKLLEFLISFHVQWLKELNNVPYLDEWSCPFIAIIYQKINNFYLEPIYSLVVAFYGFLHCSFKKNRVNIHIAWDTSTHIPILLHWTRNLGIKKVLRVISFGNKFCKQTQTVIFLKDKEFWHASDLKYIE